MLLLDLGQKTDQAIKVHRGENKLKFVAWNLQIRGHPSPPPTKEKFSSRRWSHDYTMHTFLKPIGL